jgi:hypothetical protein
MRELLLLVLELVLMATPTLYPTLPKFIAFGIYGMAAAIFVGVLILWITNLFNKKENPPLEEINSSIQRAKIILANQYPTWPQVFGWYDVMKNWYSRNGRKALESEFSINKIRRRFWFGNKPSPTPQDILDMKRFVNSCLQYLWRLQKGLP